jgi:hypothetical protein
MPNRKGIYWFVGVDPWGTPIQFGFWMVRILLVIFIADRQNDFMSSMEITSLVLLVNHLLLAWRTLAWF